MGVWGRGGARAVAPGEASTGGLLKLEDVHVVGEMPECGCCPSQVVLLRWLEGI